MTLHPPSFSLGFLAAYAFSIVLFAVLVGVPYALDWWEQRIEREQRTERKERDEAVDQLMARVAVQCA